MVDSWTGSARVEFLDIDFDLATGTQALQRVSARGPDEPFVYVVTPNVDHVVRLQRRRSDLWPVYRSAWMCLCDSRILARLAWLAGVRLKVAPGSDLTADIFRRGLASEDRIAILGGGLSLVADLKRAFGLTNIIQYDPPMGFIRDRQEVDRAVKFIVSARARYSFLAVGSPQQEIIAYQVARSGAGCGVGLCVGASLDFLLGREVRAPRMLQRMGLEWLFRLILNPQRLWVRYLVAAPKIFLVFMDWRRRMATRTAVE